MNDNATRFKVSVEFLHRACFEQSKWVWELTQTCFDANGQWNAGDDAWDEYRAATGILSELSQCIMDDETQPLEDALNMSSDDAMRNDSTAFTNTQGWCEFVQETNAPVFDD